MESWPLKVKGYVSILADLGHFPNDLAFTPKRPALEKEEMGAVGSSVDGTAEARADTHAVLLWTSRSIFLGPREGDPPTLGPKTTAQEPASACCSAPHR